MNEPSAHCWQPPRTHRQDGEERRVGIEIELAGIDPGTMLRCIQQLYGGDITEISRFEYRIDESDIGDFVVELDTVYLKHLEDGEDDVQRSEIAAAVENFSLDVLAKAAEQIVPWEIVSPPIPINALSKYAQLFSLLRDKGALGTRHALHYAFGLHLNPELPNTDPLTVLNYMRAFFCLYEWISHKERLDIARRLSPFVKHFGSDYVKTVLDPCYLPDMATLIDDYIDANPTRNRSLDMLPLFKFLDNDRVLNRIGDMRIKARPTFHYRLPNCDIDNPDWSLHKPWQLWIEVERLAASPQQLIQLCEQYLLDLERGARIFDNAWLAICETYVENSRGNSGS